MIKLTIQNNITSSINKIQQKLDNLPNEAHKEFVKNTPIRTGNARRKTRLSKDTIEANYPYAQRLDEGYSSQSPKGMTKPTEDFVNKRMKQILKGK
jgi:hypothetical protein